MNKDDLKAIRIGLGMTQTQLADALHIGLRAVQYLEAGERNITDRTAAQVRHLANGKV